MYYLHVKSQGIYKYLLTTNENSDREGFVPTAVYQNVSTKENYSRPLSEFKEKFVLIPFPTTVEEGDELVLPPHVTSPVIKTGTKVKVVKKRLFESSESYFVTLFDLENVSYNFKGQPEDIISTVCWEAK